MHSVGYPHKAEAMIVEEIQNFIQTFGQEQCGFMTILLKKRKWHRPDQKKASDLMKKIARPFKKMLRAWICIVDHHKDGAVHLHMIIAFNGEIGSLQKPIRKVLVGAGCPKVLPFELEAIRIPEAAARYLAKRYHQSIDNSRSRRRRERNISFSRGYIRLYDPRRQFSRNNVAAQRYRRKKALLGAALGIPDIDGMVDRFGTKWEYAFRDFLQPLDPLHPDGLYPDQVELLNDPVALHAWLDDRGLLEDPQDAHDTLVT